MKAQHGKCLPTWGTFWYTLSFCASGPNTQSALVALRTPPGVIISHRSAAEVTDHTESSPKLTPICLLRFRALPEFPACSLAAYRFSVDRWRVILASVLSSVEECKGAAMRFFRV